MKRKKLTAIQCMLAAVVGVSSLAGALALNKVSADADTAEKYALSDVFSATNAEVGADSDNKTAFTFEKTSQDGEDSSVTLKRDLAYTWYEGKNSAKYLTLKFTLKDANFETVDFAFDATSAWATKDDKATNVLSVKN